MRNGFTADFTVSGICENYVSAYAFVPVKQYEEEFEQRPEYLQLFLRVKDDSQEMREQLSSQILKSENVPGSWVELHADDTRKL